jgi:hypothetical protein
MEKSIKERIKEVKKEIQKLEIIRPGKLSKQKRGTKKGTYNYLSYTFQNKGATDYIKEKHVERVNKEIEAFNRFKALTDEWIELSIKLSKREMKNN